MSEDIILKRRSCPDPVMDNNTTSLLWESEHTYNTNQQSVPPIYDAYQSLLYDHEPPFPIFDHLDSYSSEATYQTLQPAAVPPAARGGHDFDRARKEIETLQAENKRLKETNAELRSENCWLKRERGFPGRYVKISCRSLCHFKSFALS